jgi:hypothetical protein
MTQLQTSASTTSDIQDYLKVSFSHKMFGDKHLAVDVSEEQVPNFSLKLDKALSGFCARQHIGGSHKSPITAQYEVDLCESGSMDMLPADVAVVIAELEKEIQNSRHA